MWRVILAFVFLGLVAIAGCSLQRAETAADAQKQMVGMTREQVLSCMGAPARSAKAGDTEVWGYLSGGDTVISGGGASHTDVVVQGNTATATTYGGGGASASHRYCDVNIVFRGGVVNRVNYTGETGGLITKGEQCAYAVEHCVR